MRCAACCTRCTATVRRRETADLMPRKGLAVLDVCAIESISADMHVMYEHICTYSDGAHLQCKPSLGSIQRVFRRIDTADVYDYHG